MSDRYYVSELEGYWDVGSISGGARAGLSCMVIDSLVCKRVMATYRSEDQRRSTGRWTMWAAARRKASEHAARLNA